MKNSHPELTLSTGIQLNNNLFNFVVEKIINYYLDKYKYLKTEIMLILNIDGLPLFSSNNKCVWPILIRIVNLDTLYPVDIILYKPSNLIVLLNKMISNVMIYNVRT